MTFTSIAVGGVAKALIGVTISLHPGSAATAHQAGDHVTVKAGDSLSSISQRAYGKAADWPALWWINRGTVRNPNAIQAGQQLRVAGLVTRGSAASPGGQAARWRAPWCWR